MDIQTNIIPYITLSKTSFRVASSSVLTRTTGSDAWSNLSEDDNHKKCSLHFQKF